MGQRTSMFDIETSPFILPFRGCASRFHLAANETSTKLRAIRRQLAAHTVEESPEHILQTNAGGFLATQGIIEEADLSIRRARDDSFICEATLLHPVAGIAQDQTQHAGIPSS